MTYREEQLILKRIEELERKQKEQSEYLEDLLKYLTDGTNEDSSVSWII